MWNNFFKAILKIGGDDCLDLLHNKNFKIHILDDDAIEEVHNDRDTENTDTTANTAKSNAKSRSSYAAPYFPTSNIYSTM